MPYCCQCGTEVEAKAKVCPVCGLELDWPKGLRLEPEAARYPARARPAPPSRSTLRTLWRGATSAALLTVLVLVVSDLLANRSVTWSMYALPGVLLAWWALVSVVWFYRKPWLVLLTQFGGLVLGLAWIDLVDGVLDWFLVLGLPVPTIALGYGLLLWLFRRVVGLDWVTWLGVAVVLLIPVFVGLDLLIGGYLGDVGPTWSLVLTTVLVPVAGLIAYLAAYLKRHQIDLWRYLHT